MDAPKDLLDIPECRTAQEIRDGVEGDAEFLTDPTSEWVRKAGVDTALRERDMLLSEVEAALVSFYNFLPQFGGYRDRSASLQNRIRKHLERAGLRARKEKP